MTTKNIFPIYEDNMNNNDKYDEISISDYVAIINRLIKQKAINLKKELLNMNEYSLQYVYSVIDYIFSDKYNSMVYQSAQKAILTNRELYHHSNILLKKLSPFQVMNFAQVIFYKTLPCPKYDMCPNRPREIAPSNQYEDSELECHYYHHEKDRRRLTIPIKVEDEFIYKANYDKSKRDPFPDKFSRNYFESMFHPIYYRLFQCKRIHCEHSFFCPFFHTKDEKSAWDEIFLMFIKKSRDVYTRERKDKTYLGSSNRNIRHDYMNKNDNTNTNNNNNNEEVYNKKGSYSSNQQIQKFPDRISSHSSSSNHSQNEFSPDQEKLFLQDWLLTPYSKVQMNSATSKAQTTAREDEEIYSMGNYNTLPRLSNIRNNNMDDNYPENTGTFSLFGDYSNIFWDVKKQLESEELQPNNSSSVLDQYFNKQVIQNFDNLRLYH